MNRADIVNALKSANFQKIYQKADAVRKREKGDVVLQILRFEQRKSQCSQIQNVF